MQRRAAFISMTSRHRATNGSPAAAVPPSTASTGSTRSSAPAKPASQRTHPICALRSQRLKRRSMSLGPAGERVIAFADFHRLPGDTPEIDTNLKADEIITAIELPAQGFAANYSYLKIRDRLSYAFALVSVAAALELEGGRIKEARLALGGVAHKPWREAGGRSGIARPARQVAMPLHERPKYCCAVPKASRTMPSRSISRAAPFVRTLTQAANGTPQIQSEQENPVSAHDILYRHLHLPRRRTREGHRRGAIRRRIQGAAVSPMAVSSHRPSPKAASRGSTRAQALAVEGVLDVLTHENRPKMANTDKAYNDEVAPGRLALSAALRRQDQVQRPADRAGARRGMGDRAVCGHSGARRVRRPRRTPPICMRSIDKAYVVEKPDKPRGNAAKAYAAAAVRHEAEYFIPIEHHNPMELFAATVVWDGDGKLTVFDKTQGVQNVQRYVCGVFGLKPDDVRVMSPFVGGASARACARNTRWCWQCRARSSCKRPVRLVLTREQMYGLGYRPATIERVALGAKTDGTLEAITHEAIAMTSQYEEFSRNDTSWSALLYKSANAKYEHKLARLDRPDALRHAGARRGNGRLCAGMRDGRAGCCTQARSRRAAPALLFGPRPEQRRSLHQQAIEGVLPEGRGGFRLGQTQSRAAIDARRHRSGRLGHGNRRLGSAADADRRSHRLDRQRPRRSVVRHLRHRHRHLHGDGTSRRRYARSADRQCHGETRRLVAATVAGRGWVMDGGLGGARHCGYRR